MERQLRLAGSHQQNVDYCQYALLNPNAYKHKYMYVNNCMHMYTGILLLHIFLYAHILAYLYHVPNVPNVPDVYSVRTAPSVPNVPNISDQTQLRIRHIGNT